MELGQAARYTLSEEWDQEGTIWPQGAVVYVVPLTEQPHETMVDVFLTDKAEQATMAENCPRFRILSSDLLIDGESIRFRRQTDR